MSSKNNIIPIFFASDDNYVPLLSVAITSLLENASKNYEYKIYVLTTNMAQDNRNKISKLAKDYASIEFICLQNELDKVKHLFRLRDYYSKETYYRFFIPSLFPKYEKVIYLDADIVVLEDISKLYNIELGDNYVAAAREDVFDLHPNFLEYPLKTYGIPASEYFNAGMMLLNTKRMLKDKIAEKFVQLAEKYTFRIVQDEDYLNVLLKDHKIMIDQGWNKTAFKTEGFDEKDLKIIHYKVIWRPWHYENVLYEDIFWKYAKQTEFFLQLKDLLNNYGDDSKKKDQDMMDFFVVATKEDSENPNNYLKTHKETMRGNKFFTKNREQNLSLRKISKLIGIKGHRSVYGSRKK